MSNRFVLAATLLLLLAITSSGCVRRRMTIRSNPPGARVFIDDQEIGTTPVSTAFTYYGTRKIRLIKDGYETTTTLQSFPAPWYQIPPIDFVTENLIPHEIRDERFVDLQLEPQRVVPQQELVNRAEQLRRSLQPSYNAPASYPSTPPVNNSSLPTEQLQPPSFQTQDFGQPTNADWPPEGNFEPFQ